MKVSLTAYTQPVNGGNPMAVVEQAACMCYDSKPTKNFAIANSCMKAGHTSVFEHINFVFEIEGVSRALLAQLTRHRHLGYTVRSQRYCSEDRFECVNPFNCEDFSRKCLEFEAVMNDIRYVYKTLKELGAENEDARMILPNACFTKLVVSANARALIEASHKRLCTRAQKEIRTMFGLMKKEVATVCPEVAKYMVPACEVNAEYPFCVESKSCGKHPKLSEVYHADK